MNVNGYKVIQWTQHWRIVRGRYYRDAIARRLTDGQLRLVSFPDH